MEKVNVDKFRKPEHKIEHIFIERWSPRAFSSEKIDKETLMRLFEAAKWAPSSYNEQPWRFIYATKEEDLKKFRECLVEGNQAWANKAPVLLFVISRKNFKLNETPNSVHAFDAGTAWGYLALQATKLGLITHGMQGFVEEKARKALKVPDSYEIHAAIAIGKHGDKKDLPQKMQEMEQPNKRRALKETIAEGKFNFK